MRTFIRFDEQERTVRATPGLEIILISLKRLTGWAHDDLSAPFWRWYWNDRPGAAVRVGEKWVRLTPGRIVLLPPGTPFATRLSGPVEHLYCHFTAGLLPGPKRKGVYVHRPSADEGARLMALARQLGSKRRGDERAIGWAAHTLTAALASRLPADAWEVGPADAAVARVLSVIHEQPGVPLDNARLARLAAVGTNTLLRRFRKATGVTPHQYVTHARLEQAAVALRTTDQSIEDVAAACGFCDRYHLSRAFKKYAYVSPAAYRKAARGDGGRHSVTPPTSAKERGVTE